jgi:hypothetical protein
MDESEFERATARGAQASGPHAVSARYLRLRGRVVVELSTGVELSIPTNIIEGLAGASADDLREIEVSPAGTGLHFPRLDADVYVPALLEGITGSPAWMAQQLGRAGGQARTARKAQASRENGKLGGRPKARTVGAAG